MTSRKEALKHAAHLWQGDCLLRLREQRLLSMRSYEKLRPLLEEYGRLFRECGALEQSRANQDSVWFVRSRVFSERRQELQSQIQQLTRMDPLLLN